MQIAIIKKWAEWEPSFSSEYFSADEIWFSDCLVYPILLI